jgi:periplasmic protein CpxP/Spy
MTKVKLLTVAVMGLLALNLFFVGVHFFGKKKVTPAETVRKGGGGPKKIIIERLGFDSAQVLAYEAAIAEHRKGIKTGEDSIKALKDELYATLTGNDTLQREQLMARITQWHRFLEALHYQHFTNIKNICRPDQLPAYEALTHQLTEFFNPRKGRPDGPPRDGERPPGLPPGKGGPPPDGERPPPGEGVPPPTQ